MNRLSIIILIFLFTLSSEAASQSNSLPPIEAYSSIHNYVLEAILDNLIYMKVVNNYEDYTELNASECGVLEVNTDIFNLSYYFDHCSLILVSLIKPNSNNLWVGRVTPDHIESWLEYNNLYAESWPCPADMTFENWLMARTVFKSYNKYLTYILLDFNGGMWGDEVDLVGALNGMYDVMGIRVLPIDGHDMRFEYEYIPDREELKWTFYFDDCTGWETSYQTSPTGGFINSDMKLTGVIEIN